MDLYVGTGWTAISDGPTTIAPLKAVLITSSSSRNYSTHILYVKHVMNLFQAMILEAMFCGIIIGCAFDGSFEFNWLRSGYTLDQNSTDVRFSKDVNITYLG